VNGARSLYSLRLGLRAPEWEDVPDESIDMPGERLSSIGDAARQPLEKEASDEFLHPSLPPLPRGSSFVRDEAELAMRLQQGKTLLDMFQARSLAPGFLGQWAAFEATQMEKLTCQRGASPMWFVQPGGYVTTDKPSLAEAFSVMAKRYRKPTLGGARYKQGTNHGFPLYLTTWTDYMMHAFWANASGPDFDAFSRLGEQLASTAGEGATPLSMIQFNRSGPTKKTLPGYTATAGGPVHDCNLTSLAPRRRGVNGIPSAANMVQQRAVTAAQAVVYLDERRHHNGHADVSAKLRAHYKPGRDVVSDDISSFDMSVSFNHQAEMDEYLWVPLLGREVAAFKAQVRQLPLLIPPIYTNDQAFACTRHGTTASGDLTTALDGGWINEARILTALARAKGWSVAAVDACFGREIYYLVQGDDTVIEADRGFVNFDKYAAESQALGYSTKLQPGAVFLMTLHDPASGMWCPLASRVFQQTVFNEYGGTSTAMEVFSWIARTPPEFWQHNPWARNVAEALRHSHAFEEWAVTPTTAIRAFDSHEYNRALAATLMAAPKATARARMMPGTQTLIDAGKISDAASALLRGDDDAKDLPIITHAEAKTAALTLAEWLGQYRTDREVQKVADLTLGSAAANDYLAYITNTHAYSPTPQEEE